HASERPANGYGASDRRWWPAEKVSPCPRVLGTCHGGISPAGALGELQGGRALQLPALLAGRSPTRGAASASASALADGQGIFLVRGDEAFAGPPRDLAACPSI